MRYGKLAIATAIVLLAAGTFAVILYSDGPDTDGPQYSITYDANGGFGAPAAETGLPSDLYDLNISDDPAHDRIDSHDVLFKGWSLRRVPVLEAGGTVPPLTTQANVAESRVTVYAVWAIDRNDNGIPDVDEERYNIIYDVSGGNRDGPAAQTDLLSAAYDLSAAGPTHPQVNGTDVLFAGWSFIPPVTVLSARDDSPDYISSVTVIDADVTVYAVWGLDANSNGIPDVNEDYYITATSDQGAVISPAGITVLLKGSDQTFSFTAKDGHKIDSVTVDGSHLTHAQISLGSYTFADVMMNHTISVTTVDRHIMLEVTIAEGSGRVSVSENGKALEAYVSAKNIREHADLCLTAYASDGYDFKEWRTADGTVYSAEEISFENVTESVRLYLYFSPRP